jgi:glucosyl-3-phosphoglycerate synthase
MTAPSVAQGRLHRFHHSAFPAERVAAQRQVSVSVCLPARNEAETIGPIVQALLPLVDLGAIDQVIVLDDSADGTAEIAAALGAEVHDQSSLCPQAGPVQGKGDALWRALEVAHGEVVVYLDADSHCFGPHFACGLAGPIACDPRVAFAKACYRRPWQSDGVVLPEGGGRVTELCARPLLAAFYPELAAFLQPLAGEMALRRDLVERLPFVCGYGVDVALLIDAWHAVGIRRMVEVDLDVRQNRHQPLSALAPMADAVLAAICSRLLREGRLPPDAVPGHRCAVERPPAAAVRHPAGAPGAILPDR